MPIQCLVFSLLFAIAIDVPVLLLQVSATLSYPDPEMDIGFTVMERLTRN